jgi:hypothetical protein
MYGIFTGETKNYYHFHLIDNNSEQTGEIMFIPKNQLKVIPILYRKGNKSKY